MEFLLSATSWADLFEKTNGDFQARAYIQRVLRLKTLHQFCSDVDLFLFQNDFSFGMHYLAASRFQTISSLVDFIFHLGLWDFFVRRPHPREFADHIGILIGASRIISGMLPRNFYDITEDCSMCAPPAMTGKRLTMADAHHTYHKQAAIQ